MRNFKALGLALVAAFAMSAVVASVASATAFQAVDKEEKYLVMEDSGAVDFTTSETGEVSCTGESLTADFPEGEPTAISFVPNFNNCKTAGAAFVNVTKTANGCTFTFDSHGHIVLDCPAGKNVEIHHYSNQAHTTLSCTETTSPQSFVGTVTYTNEADGTVTVSGAPKFSRQTHGACSFGFTLNLESTWDLSATMRPVSVKTFDVSVGT